MTVSTVSKKCLSPCTALLTSTNLHLPWREAADVSSGNASVHHLSKEGMFSRSSQSLALQHGHDGFSDPMSRLIVQDLQQDILQQLATNWSGTVEEHTTQGPCTGATSTTSGLKAEELEELEELEALGGVKPSCRSRTVQPLQIFLRASTFCFRWFLEVFPKVLARYTGALTSSQ